MRQRAGLTQDQLAARVGMDRSYISDVERGTALVSVDLFLQICRGARMPAGDILNQVEAELTKAGVAKATSRR